VKDLSKATVSTIVNALIDTRLDAIKTLAGAERAGHAEHKTLMQQWLDANAAAFRELNEEAAPWLRYHPQLHDVFPDTVCPRTRQQYSQEAPRESSNQSAP
jgi:hypothetical protein